MSDKITKNPPYHVGMPGINSPGYAPRKGTEKYEEAEAWTKDYWARLFAARKEPLVKIKKYKTDEQ